MKLSEEDTKELLRLYDRANNAPLIKVGDGSISAMAHKRLDDFMKEMATKYGYDYATNAINGEGEVVPI